MAWFIMQDAALRHVIPDPLFVFMPMTSMTRHGQKPWLASCCVRFCFIAGGGVDQGEDLGYSSWSMCSPRPTSNRTTDGWFMTGLARPPSDTSALRGQNSSSANLFCVLAKKLV
jgi:hypothetical protein